jgi:hypothetical protein
LKRADTRVIEVADPNCRGVTDPSGRRVYRRDARGRIELPKAEAARILASGHRDTRAYRPVFALSMADVLERAARRVEKEE